MKDRTASLFPLAILVLLAALTFWLNRLIQGDTPRGPVRHDPDYWVENFKVRRFDANGRLQHTLVGARLVHHPDDDTTIIETPQLNYLRRPPTEIHAGRAIIDSKGKEVELVDGVQVIREGADARQPPTLLETKSLKVFPDDERGRTADPVLITRGSSVIRGTGLEIDNRTGVTVLRGRVTGTLHRNQGATP